MSFVLGGGEDFFGRRGVFAGVERGNLGDDGGGCGGGFEGGEVAAAADAFE